MRKKQERRSATKRWKETEWQKKKEKQKTEWHKDKIARKNDIKKKQYEVKVRW